MHETILYQHLTIPSFSMLHLEEFSLTQAINQHAILRFSGTLSEEEPEDPVYVTEAGKLVEVYYESQTDHQSHLLFGGIVASVENQREKDTSVLFVTAYSLTYLLDRQRKQISYQNTGISHQGMINQVLSWANGAELAEIGTAMAVYHEEAGQAIGEYVVQYKETDWEFLKRMASKNHVGLLPDTRSGTPSFYYGMSSGQKAIALPIEKVSIEKNLGDYVFDQKNDNLGTKEPDYIQYQIKSNQIVGMETPVLFQEKVLFIKKAVYTMEAGMLKGNYLIGTKNGLRQRKLKNHAIRGVSLYGTVAKVERDKVYVSLLIDGGGTSYAFPYATMSASPDGSGWYYMPEENDPVRVYFPDEEEKHAYAVSTASAYLPKEGASDRMSDPNVKYLRTANNMELMLTPDAVKISANDGKAQIILDKEGNINITAVNTITVNAEENINLLANKTLSLFATEKLELSGGGSTYTMEQSGDTKITGQYVLEN